MSEGMTPEERVNDIHEAMSEAKSFAEEKFLLGEAIKQAEERGRKSATVAAPSEELSAEERAKKITRSDHDAVTLQAGIAQAIRDAEERGRQSVQVAAPSSCWSCGETYKPMKSGARNFCSDCGAPVVKPEGALSVNINLRPLSGDQTTCMERGGLTQEEISRPWADLLPMEDKELRKRLRSRAVAWRHGARWLAELLTTLKYPVDVIDIQILVDRIYDMERDCTMEAERLWDVRLDEQGDKALHGTPEDVAEVYRALGPRHAEVAIHRAQERAAAPKPREGPEEGETLSEEERADIYRQLKARATPTNKIRF